MSSSRRITPSKSFLFLLAFYLIGYGSIRSNLTPAEDDIRAFGLSESTFRNPGCFPSTKAQIQLYTSAALTTLYYPLLMIEESIFSVTFMPPSALITISNGGAYEPHSP
ncbi:hypothetical protein Rhal01_02168 [Rubritalea halochordaticola]|uniref:Uncharacterized protein n=1 Tax=Rubritalea halochordaticola TaxID=714537 RepID=A0ABP9V020_9BACT